MEDLSYTDPDYGYISETHVYKPWEDLRFEFAIKDPEEPNDEVSIRVGADELISRHSYLKIGQVADLVQYLMVFLKYHGYEDDERLKWSK